MWMNSHINKQQNSLIYYISETQNSVKKKLLATFQPVSKSELCVLGVTIKNVKDVNRKWHFI